MRRIEAYRTADGRIFADHRAAVRHADELAGAAITKHARALATLDKYTATVSYLEQHAAELATIAELIRDRDNLEGDDHA